MMRVVTTPLAPFVDELPRPSRRIVGEHDGRLADRARQWTGGPTRAARALIVARR
jgi:hypothetical protein